MPKSRKQQYQELFAQYLKEHPEQEATPLDHVYRWAKDNGLWRSHPRDEAKTFRNQLADALREEHRVDASGRKHRAKLPVVTYSGGVQTVLWGDIDRFPLPLFQKNVAQRRNGIVGDCVQLRLDIDHYNDAHPLAEDVQMEFDFADDVEEKLLAQHQKNAA